MLSLKKAALRMSFAGSGAGAPRGTAKLPGTVTSLIGNDKSKWVHGAPTFARVAYPHVWGGIDSVFYGNGRHLEYDLRVAPDADPSAIRLHFDGQRTARLAANGDLVLGLPDGGQLRQRAPVSYQRLNGTRTPVASRFVLGEDGRVGVVVGTYDHHRPLIVDPTVAYGTYIGGSSADQGTGIAVDAGGSAYLTGITSSTDFPTARTGTDQNAFVIKLNAAGTAVTYGTYIGGTGFETGNGIAVDGSGSAYVTGSTTSGDFPTTAGSFQATRTNGSSDAFVVKLDATGTNEAYGTYVGGSSTDNGFAIAVDGAGSAYLTGLTSSTNFPVSPNTTRSGSGTDAFAVKLNPSGSAETYGMYLGGTGTDQGNAIAFDSTGSAYIAGDTTSADFPTTRAATDQDAFAVKLSATGTVTYGTYLGGTGTDSGNGIAVDGTGSAYLVGTTASADFPTTAGALQTALAGTQDAYAVKLDPTGTAKLYSTYLGGTRSETGTGIAVDATGSAYLTGDTTSNDFRTTSGTPKPTRTSTDFDAFAVKLNTTGSAETYGTYIGGSGGDQGYAIAIDGSGSAYLTGSTLSANAATFPLTPGAVKTTLTAGDTDAYAIKLADATAVGWRGARVRRLRQRGVRVSWQTGRDSDTLGFDVVRVRQGKHARVTRRLIPGGATSSRTSFAFTDRNGRRGDRYLIVERRLDGSRETHAAGPAGGRQSAD